MRRLLALLALIAAPALAQPVTSVSGHKYGASDHALLSASCTSGDLWLTSDGNPLAWGCQGGTWKQLFALATGFVNDPSVCSAGSAPRGVDANGNATGCTVFVTPSDAQTLTAKRITPRVGSVASSATPSIDSDSYDLFEITALAEDITSVTVTGTPTDGQTLWLAIVPTAARAITLGSQFEASSIPLPTTTGSVDRLDLGFVFNAVTGKFRLVAIA